MEAARLKLKVLERTTDVDIQITGHAFDQFSLRFIDVWDKTVGISTFLRELAQKALEKGEDISTRKNKTDRVIYYQGIKFVFNRDEDSRVLITVME